MINRDFVQNGKMVFLNASLDMSATAVHALKLQFFLRFLIQKGLKLAEYSMKIIYTPKMINQSPFYKSVKLSTALLRKLSFLVEKPVKPQIR